MSLRDFSDDERRRAGLCADCRHARQVRSSHDSVFYLCEYSNVDARFPKYPRLPVLACEAHTTVANDPRK
jgi:hypothetical protein